MTTPITSADVLREFGVPAYSKLRGSDIARYEALAARIAADAQRIQDLTERERLAQEGWKLNVDLAHESANEAERLRDKLAIAEQTIDRICTATQALVPVGEAPELSKHIVQIVAQLAAAAQDSERLDALEGAAVDVFWRHADGYGSQSESQVFQYRVAKRDAKPAEFIRWYPTIRAAIDAAFPTTEPTHE